MQSFRSEIVWILLAGRKQKKNVGFDLICLETKIF